MRETENTLKRSANKMNFRRKLLLLATVWMVLTSQAAILAQTAPSKMLAFEVVSIRRNMSGVSPQSLPKFAVTADGVVSTNLPLIGLFQFGYVPTGMGDSGFFRGNQISGAPDWLTSGERYDVVAKVAEADLAEWQKPAQQTAMARAMLRSLLTERMKAVAHIESKEIPVYDLVVAKNGPKFKKAATVDANELKQQHPGGNVTPMGGMMSPGSSPGQMNLYGVSMVLLAQILSNFSGRPVVDKTGLAGGYDLSMQAEPPPPPQSGQQGAAGAGDAEPSIFTMVQEQFGLKLEPAKDKVETLVIDHVERPTEN